MSKSNPIEGSQRSKGQSHTPVVSRVAPRMQPVRKGGGKTSRKSK